MVASTTNKEYFEEFIDTMIVPEIRENLPNKPYLLIDNHPGHKNPILRLKLDQHFNVLFMPSYSCRFNSIENLWGYVKLRYMQSFPNHFNELERI